MSEFSPPEYKIAWQFKVDGFTEQEVVDIIKNMPTLPQSMGVRIHNAYRDITHSPKLYEGSGVWQNKQISKLMFKKWRNELPDNKK